jgi:hypothetical protein
LDQFDFDKERLYFLESSEFHKFAIYGLLLSLHWCTLHAFCSNSGLHPPKMGTISRSHSNAAYSVHVDVSTSTLCILWYAVYVKF